MIPVHSATKLLKAIENKDFEKEIDGIPVLKYASVMPSDWPGARCC